MEVVARIFMFVNGTVGLGLSIVALLLAIQVLDLQGGYQLFSNYIGRWELILAATVCALIALISVFLAVYYKADKAILVQITEHGRVAMSVEAFQKLIEKYVKKSAGLHNIKSKIQHNEQIINIKIMADALPECKVSEITKLIQENVGQGIKDSLGREVNNIEVYIQDINNQPK